MPRDFDVSPTSKFKSSEIAEGQTSEKLDVESTSRLHGLSGDSIDLDLDRLATALGSGDTVEQPRAEDDVFSTEVFEASQRNRRVDLDVGDALNGTESPTNKLQSLATSATTPTAKIDLALPELEPVTMSEVGTKLDLARAYMDMGDPEGARSILEEVVQEGSTSQKQEAQRLIETLPG
jgi:pilus assembly protein FimV